TPHWSLRRISPPPAPTHTEVPASFGAPQIARGTASSSSGTAVQAPPGARRKISAAVLVPLGREPTAHASPELPPQTEGKSPASCGSGTKPPLPSSRNTEPALPTATTSVPPSSSAAPLTEVRSFVPRPGTLSRPPSAP